MAGRVAEIEAIAGKSSIREGDILWKLDEGARRAISSMARTCDSSEWFWLRQLWEVTSGERLTHLEQVRVVRRVEQEMTFETSSLRAAAHHLGASIDEVITAELIVRLARAGVPLRQIWLADRELSTRIRGLWDLFSELVPLGLSVLPSTPERPALVCRHLRRLRQRGTFYSDIFTRYAQAGLSPPTHAPLVLSFRTGEGYGAASEESDARDGIDVDPPRVIARLDEAVWGSLLRAGTRIAGF
jgi:hypothetical protein